MAPAGPRRPRDTLAAPAAPPEHGPALFRPRGGTRPAPPAGDSPSTPPHREPRGQRATSIPCTDPHPQFLWDAPGIASLLTPFPIPVLSAPPYQHSHSPSLLSPSHRARATGGVSPLMPHSQPPPLSPSCSHLPQAAQQVPARRGERWKKPGSDLQAPRPQLWSSSGNHPPQSNPREAKGRAGVTAKQTGKKILLVFLRNSI